MSSLGSSYLKSSEEIAFLPASVASFALAWSSVSPPAYSDDLLLLLKSKPKGLAFKPDDCGLPRVNGSSTYFSLLD